MKYFHLAFPQLHIIIWNVRFIRIDTSSSNEVCSHSSCVYLRYRKMWKAQVQVQWPSYLTWSKDRISLDLSLYSSSFEEMCVFASWINVFPITSKSKTLSAQRMTSNSLIQTKILCLYFFFCLILCFAALPRQPLAHFTLGRTTRKSEVRKKRVKSTQWNYSCLILT